MLQQAKIIKNVKKVAIVAQNKDLTAILEKSNIKMRPKVCRSSSGRLSNFSEIILKKLTIHAKNSKHYNV